MIVKVCMTHIYMNILIHGDTQSSLLLQMVGNETLMRNRVKLHHHTIYSRIYQVIAIYIQNVSAILILDFIETPLECRTVRVIFALSGSSISHPSHWLVQLSRPFSYITLNTEVNYSVIREGYWYTSWRCFCTHFNLAYFGTTMNSYMPPCKYQLQ